jgi:hypothetical protein
METHETSGVKPESAESTAFWVSLATAPMLAGLWGAQALLNSTVQLGRASEELFRGDRLPILNFPADSTEENSEERPERL